MSEIVFLLEEASARALLEGLLPKLLPAQVSTRFVVFQGKQDLERGMVRRLQGYLVPGARFVILRDQDSGDCRAIKERLLAKCAEAGKPDAHVRIACTELESWYLGDLAAVEQAFPGRGLSHKQGRAPFSRPDSIGSPSKKLQEIAPEYQKVGGSRRIGPHLRLEGNKSRSFQGFVRCIRRLADELNPDSR